MNRINKLLAEMCPNGVLVSTVGETCKVERGKVYSKQYIRDNQGDYPLYSSQTQNDGLLGRINTYDYDGEYLNWTTDGANAGSIFHRRG
jgi:type I restriction enzyme S subunit